MRWEEMIPVAEAEAILAGRMPRYPSVTLPLSRCLGRVLRRAVAADRPQPPFHRATMDGIAIAYPAWERGVRRFPVLGVLKAGQPPGILAAEDGCLEIMTGAVLPAGADCVIPVEDVHMHGGAAVIRLRPGQPGPMPMGNVHRAGSDCAADEIIVAEGTRLAAPHLAAAASFGYARLEVSHAPRTAVVATGDELVDPGKTPALHQIRRSNPHAVEAALRRVGIDRIASLHSRDDPERLRRRLEGVLGRCEALVLTGGVSMGKTDHVPAVLTAAGIRPWFHKIRQKPGKPFWFGTGPSGLPVFALPGNPASVLVCLYRYVLPALQRAMGRLPGPLPLAALEEDAPATGDFTHFRPVKTHQDSDGRLRAAFSPHRGSGDFPGWARCDGFVELAAGGKGYLRDQAVPVYLW